VASSWPRYGFLVEPDAGGTAPDWWEAVPSGQATFLAAPDPELLEVAPDPLPAGVPAVVQYPAAALRPGRDVVDLLLKALERVVCDLFPAWFPGAERLEPSTELGTRALGTLAQARAARSDNFATFLDRPSRNAAPAATFPARSWAVNRSSSASRVRVLSQVSKRALVNVLPSGRALSKA
jgi:hypothetical protein